MISLLHISDYHAGGTQEGQPYLRKRVLGEPWLRNLDTLQEQGAIHYILFKKEKKDLLATLMGTPCMGVSYRLRGLVTAEGMPFGQVFHTFLEDQA